LLDVADKAVLDQRRSVDLRHVATGCNYGATGSKALVAATKWLSPSFGAFFFT
jgi:hypothetical protein